MQPGPLIGIAVALLAILGGNVLEGGHLGSILGGPAAMIVVGGTLGAVLVQYPVSTAGGYAPTVGIIGAVLGLIHVMSNLSDIGAVGAGIAGAFVATIYGVAVANIIFLPLGGRIKLRLRDEITFKELTLVGVLAIQAGMNPKLVRERLSEFVHSPSNPKKGSPAGEAASAPA